MEDLLQRLVESIVGHIVSHECLEPPKARCCSKDRGVGDPTVGHSLLEPTLLPFNGGVEGSMDAQSPVLNGHMIVVALTPMLRAEQNMARLGDVEGPWNLDKVPLAIIILDGEDKCALPGNGLTFTGAITKSIALPRR